MKAREEKSIKTQTRIQTEERRKERETSKTTKPLGSKHQPNE